MPATTTRQPRAPGLISKSEAARRLGVSQHTVTDLSRRLGLVPKPIPGCRLGEGLDESDYARLAWRLRPEPAPVS